MGRWDLWKGSTYNFSDVHQSNSIFRCLALDDGSFAFELSTREQGRHGKFEPGKAPYSILIFLTGCFL